LDIYSFYLLSGLVLLLIVAGGYRIQQTRRRKKESIRLMKDRLEITKQRIQELEQENKHLLCLSYLDGLTGISNRRHFEEAFNLEWRRACRSGTALSLIMIDADFFKAFNDAYGHQHGDNCLIRLAGILRNALNRPGDMVARYGGEEFIIILPETDAQGAAELAEVIRARVEAMETTPEGFLTDKTVTVSLGVVTDYPTRGFSSAALISAADEALYQAKVEGRNRVIISGEAMRNQSNHHPLPTSQTGRARNKPN
jgi:diguanylate cyclase (GGDEF)-like protein